MKTTSPFGASRSPIARWGREFKSLVLSCLCLYELHAFGEPGAQVYAAATDRKTARRMFDTASTMAQVSEYLRGRLLIGKENICDPETRSKFEPCAAEDQNLQGLRPSFVCMDELHAHANDGVWNAFYTRLGKCRQPLMFAITNSGFDRNSVCYKQREYSEKVLRASYRMTPGLHGSGRRRRWPERFQLGRRNRSGRWLIHLGNGHQAYRDAGPGPQSSRGSEFPEQFPAFAGFAFGPRNSPIGCGWTYGINATWRLPASSSQAAAVMEALIFLLRPISRPSCFSLSPIEDDRRWHVLPFFFFQKN